MPDGDSNTSWHLKQKCTNFQLHVHTQSWNTLDISKRKNADSRKNFKNPDVESNRNWTEKNINQLDPQSQYLQISDHNPQQKV